MPVHNPNQRAKADRVAPRVPLLWRLRMTAVQRAIPLHAMLEVTNRCNLHCRHCYIEGSDSGGELTLEEYRRLLDSLAGSGCLFLTFSGGEPLVRKDFFDIAGYARKRAFSVVIFTNGTLVTPEVARRIRALHPQRVEISILGGCAATHDAITGVEGSFDKALEATRLLRECGVRIQFKTTWMRMNIDEEESVRALASAHGAAFRDGFQIIHHRDRGAPPDLSVTPEQLQASARRRLSRQAHRPPPPPPEPVPEEARREIIPCGAGQSSCVIGARGEVYPCAAIPVLIGNVRQEALPDIWSGSAELRRIRAIRLSDLSECGSCRLFLRCSRCAGSAEMETGSLLAASPTACAVARAFEELYEQRRCEIH